jgi:hypothetical protein
MDMSQTIAPKSDQINADDLIGGPRTITVTRVTGNEGNAEQPVNVFFEGDNGKPFRPCKSMRRVMVKVWGADASKYVGNSMTIYPDPKVKWGGMEVGGIRISHMTGIDAPQVMALTETRSKRAPYTVKPLKDVPQAQGNTEAAEKAGRTFITNIGRAPDLEKLDEYAASKSGLLDDLKRDLPDLHAEAVAVLEAKRTSFAPAEQEAEEDPFATEGAE